MKTCINDNSIILVGFPVRLVAYLIDIIIINIAFCFVKMPLMIVKIFASDIILFKEVLFNFTAIDIFFYILGSAYFVLTIYYNGATIGKMIMNIKVVNNNGDNLKLFDIIYRETIGRYLSSIFYIGYILIFVNKDKKALHDMLSDTQVIYNKEQFRIISTTEKEEILNEEVLKSGEIKSWEEQVIKEDDNIKNILSNKTEIHNTEEIAVKDSEQNNYTQL